MANKINFKLPSANDLFSTREEREESKNKKFIRDIPLFEIDSFSNHPFSVLDDEDMAQLVESIRERGVDTAALVRQKSDGRYELISGHRRKRACEILGIEALKCEVLELNDDEAVIAMVESNLMGRSRILPSNKAFAYKMRLEAMNRRAGRPQKNNLTPVVSDLEKLTPAVSDLRTNEKLGKETGESREQIRRYIRLTELTANLLKMVDDNQFPFRPAVEISYLKKEEQKILFGIMEKGCSAPSLEKAEELKRQSQKEGLTKEMIERILNEKKNAKAEEKRAKVFYTERLKTVIPPTKSFEEAEDYIYKACVFYRENNAAKNE